jgi:hypothetical protein
MIAFVAGHKVSLAHPWQYVILVIIFTIFIKVIMSLVRVAKNQATDKRGWQKWLEKDLWIKSLNYLPLLKFEWVGVLGIVLWARSRAGEARRSEPLTATAGPYNRVRLNAALCGIQQWKQKPVDAEPTV